MLTEADKEWFANQIKDELSVLYNVAYALLGNRDDAEDAVCEAVLQGWQSFERLKDRQFFRPWQMKILKYVAYSMLRKRKKHLEYTDTVLSYSQNKLDYDFETIESNEDLYKAMEKLSKDDRFILTLFYMEDYSIKEICAIFKASEGTVKSKLHRARKKLKDYLKEV